MASKNVCFLSVLLFIRIFSAVFLYAQEGDYFIVRENDGPRFMQRLSWGHDEYVLRYEMILEDERDEGYVEILRKTTEENYLVLSLRPGRFRYAVNVYNLLDKMEYTMDWVYFEVLRALQPKILGFTPGEIFLESPDTDVDTLLVVNGEDLVPGADIMLRLQDNPQGPEVPEQGIRPRKQEIDGQTARLTFSGGQLEPGAYSVYVRNPGGLDDSRGILSVRLRENPEQDIPAQDIPAQDIPEQDIPAQTIPKTTVFDLPDINVSLGYFPLMPLYGGLFSAGVFDSPLLPLGEAARISILPFTWRRYSLGLELGGSWNRLEAQTEHYDVAAQLIEAQLSLLYQLWLSNRTMAFNFRLGAGLSILRDFYFDYHSGTGDSLDSRYLSLDAGVSFQWLIKGPFFIEAGVDFTHILSSDDTSAPGYLQPVLSAGWKF
ncbi:MAG: hypothetical protein LBR99_02910 [Treponema sp.]|jgi:hypothetical protein|nr:hypothetical protein [Treponema sp.]